MTASAYIRFLGDFDQMLNIDRGENHPESNRPVFPDPGANPVPEVVLSVRGLSKSYDGMQAVSGLDIEIGAGSIVGLVGPNGAGKTTAMRCMAGIIPPTEGEISILGRNIAVDPLGAKRQLAFVPDTPHLFDYLTIEEHLNFAARIYQVADWRQRADELLKEFELDDKRRHLPQALSRGMRQKVAICLGFLHRPRAIILDEPLTGLDPLGIRRMKDAITSRARAWGAAVIVSSHQLELVEEICDSIVILQQGKALISGTLASIRERLGAADEQLSLEEIFFRVTLPRAEATSPSAQLPASSVVTAPVDPVVAPENIAPPALPEPSAKIEGSAPNEPRS